jgi:hypothetical protein
MPWLRQNDNNDEDSMFVAVYDHAVLLTMVVNEFPPSLAAVKLPLVGCQLL